MRSELESTDFLNALLQINRTKAALLFEDCFRKNSDFRLLEAMTINALEQVGQGWETGKYSLAQVYMSGVICEELVDRYLPRVDVKRQNVPKIAIAVLLDHHALGKRIVYSMVRASGFEIVDFGAGLSVDELVERTLSEQIEVLLISTLMLPSALKVKQVKELLNKAGASVKIVVGGAPFRLDETLWEAVNADAFGKTASDIIPIIEQMSEGGN